MIIVIVAGASYLVGAESVKSRGKNYEDLRHQLGRLWSSPDAKKARKRFVHSVGKSFKRTGQHLRQMDN